MTTVDIQDQTNFRLERIAELQKETERMYDDVADYQEANGLLSETIAEVDVEMVELEGEYDRLKEYIEEGQKKVNMILVSLLQG